MSRSPRAGRAARSLCAPRVSTTSCSRAGADVRDRARRRLLLARDPLGIKPVYYREANGRLAFASEAKALLLDPACPREPDLEALAAYLTFLYVPSPATAFAGIRKLAPGHALVFE